MDTFDLCNKQFSIDQVTIVSCFYVIEKSKHRLVDYVMWMINFFKIKTKKIIFTDQHTYDRLFKQILDPNTDFYIYEINDFKMSKWMIEFEWLNQHNKDPEAIIHSKELYKIWNEKTEMLYKAIQSNRHKSKYFIWCDVGCFRNENMDKFKSWPSIKKLKKSNDNIILLNINSFTKEELSSNDIVNFERLDRIGGGIFGGSINACLKWHTEYYKMFQNLRENGFFIGKDQSIMANIYIDQLRKNNKMIDLIKIPHGYKGNKWFYLQDYLL